MDHPVSKEPGTKRFIPTQPAAALPDKLNPRQNGCDFAALERAHEPRDTPDRHPREHTTGNPYDDNSAAKARAMAEFYTQWAERLEASNGGALRYGSGSIGGGFPMGGKARPAAF